MYQFPLNNSFWCGTSGVVLPFRKAQFPPEFKDKSRLHYYASLFNSIEFNNTFYKLPQATTVRKWAESVPDDFRFTFKVPQSITHSMKWERKDVLDFLNMVGQVGDRRGCLLGQFPPSFSLEQMGLLEKLLRAFADESDMHTWKLVVEFRHPSWEHPLLDHLLVDYNVAKVVHDMNDEVLRISEVIGNVVYLRLHGPEPRYRGSYSGEFLKKLADRFKQWMREGRTVYAYFNNSMGNAFDNAQDLIKGVS